MDLHPIQDEKEMNFSESLQDVTQISELLGTGLSQEQLSIIIELLNYGVNAEQLAKMIIQLRKKAQQDYQRINFMFGMNN